MKQFLTSLLIFGVVVFGFRRVGALQSAGLFAGGGKRGVLGGTLELVSQSDGFYRTQGIWF